MSGIPEAWPAGAERQSPRDKEPDAVGPRTARSVRWSLGAVLAKQGFQILSAVVLARILGPQSYGVIVGATVYISLVMLVLDQGLSAALIQRPAVTRRMAGATVTLNLILATLLGTITWFAAPWLSGFFRISELEPILQVLAIAVPIKALAITPRAMLARELRLHLVGASDIAAAVAGSAAAIGAAIAGAGPWAMVYQVVVTDLVCAAALIAAGKGPLPSLKLQAAIPLLKFSASIFATDCLAYFSRNLGNILVGRFLGVAALSLYGMAYRIMVLPVQLLGQTVNRVMFPAFARAAQEPKSVAAKLVDATRILAVSAIPLMAFVACAAPALVNLVLGPAWLPAAALISILAIGGARETVFYVTPSLMKGLGRGGLIIRYEILAAVVQVSGIVVGLQFGLLGVAVGYVASGFVLTPVLLHIQKWLTGVTARSQLGTIFPGAHAAAWGAAGYGLLSLSQLGDAAMLLGGFAVFMAAAVSSLWLFHRRFLKDCLHDAALLIGRSRPHQLDGLEDSHG
ncbi:lipopolysaccharide biosynthesis protein [Pseudarthrobacter sp. NPDC058362]|uniref:lipopolysaccharide biosynthesis protein n=1 Tax=Pseudarthrobacter sp. NPDC058362 TaxID=3346458 RepID=UPI003666474E